MRTIYVAAGDYVISEAGEQIKLVALLGTCVGVAIFDSSNDIGGLCHILLDKPNDPENVWQPRNYASTSLPFFVDDLLKKGAQRDRLQAAVAGGSLSAPFCVRDLNMDIGGRNSEAVLQYLDRHHIPIIKKEIGGCNAMNLTFIARNCQVNITHIISAMESRAVSYEPKIPSKEDIRAAIAAIKPIPQVALKLIRLLRLDDYDIDAISEEIKSDQVLSAKLLSYCNSSFFGFRANIDSVDRAVVCLGGEYLIEAIVSTAVASFYEQGKKGGYTLVKGGMFRHSTAVAHLAKVIARLSGKEDEQTAYTAGLLHDIGKVVLDNFVSDARPLFYLAEQEKVDDFIELEQRCFRCDHQTIGRKLAKIWDIPANLKEVISYHHTPGRAKKFQKLTTIVHIADVLASLVVAGVEMEKINATSFTKGLASLGMTDSMVPQIIGEVPWNRLMYG